MCVCVILESFLTKSFKHLEYKYNMSLLYIEKSLFKKFYSLGHFCLLNYFQYLYLSDFVDPLNVRDYKNGRKLNAGE